MAGSMTTGHGTVVLAWNGGSGVEMSGSVGLNPSKRVDPASPNPSKRDKSTIPNPSKRAKREVSPLREMKTGQLWEQKQSNSRNENGPTRGTADSNHCNIKVLER
ncbi:hypothetical protein H6A11_00025 [Bifidobacterium pullorum subsp. saeculare]|uniref:hypothetical protein n=1 Tax=Bifidobacterium pullorum TaxID=78448 RepID=UPI00195B3A16|nr:hypothetical protein [Bifidobacterium pullorum]MBM6695446.1 hypothetical protein [Bifidobacterium pullorum subsp. saeculare]